MAIGRITYADKVDYQQQGQDSKYKITAQDMNQIKKVFNDSASAIESSISTLDTAVSKAQTSEANAKKYMDNAKASADSVLNGLGMVVVDGCICMYDDEEE